MVQHGRQGGRLQQQERLELGAAGGRDRSRSRSPRSRELPAPATTSYLAQKLLLKWAWHSMSAGEVQELAAAAQNDFGQTNEAIRRLASLGSSGRNPQNCQRDLISWFMRKPTKHLLHALPGPDCEVDTVLFPHEVFSLLAKDFPAEFHRRLGAERVSLERFWSSFQATRLGRELMQSHPYLRGGPWRDEHRYVQVEL